jgi:hypothetical protein
MRMKYKLDRKYVVGIYRAKIIAAIVIGVIIYTALVMMFTAFSPDNPYFGMVVIVMAIVTVCGVGTIICCGIDMDKEWYKACKLSDYIEKLCKNCLWHKYKDAVDEMLVLMSGIRLKAYEGDIYLYEVCHLVDCYRDLIESIIEGEREIRSEEIDRLLEVLRRLNNKQHIDWCKIRAKDSYGKWYVDTKKEGNSGVGVDESINELISWAKEDEIWQDMSEKCSRGTKPLRKNLKGLGRVIKRYGNNIDNKALGKFVEKYGKHIRKIVTQYKELTSLSEITEEAQKAIDTMDGTIEKIDKAVDKIKESLCDQMAFEASAVASSLNIILELDGFGDEGMQIENAGE